MVLTGRIRINCSDFVKRLYAEKVSRKEDTMTGQLWVFVWFIVGMLAYMLKRAYYLIKGPNQVATTWLEFIQRCWVPLLVRFLIESVAFWGLFNEQVTGKVLGYLGWTSYEWAVIMITEVPQVAFFFGMTVDSIADFLVTKIPFIKDWLPQMPGPLPKPEQP